jgi:hypothetical protein
MPNAGSEVQGEPESTLTFAPRGQLARYGPQKAPMTRLARVMPASGVTCYTAPMTLTDRSLRGDSELSALVRHDGAIVCSRTLRVEPLRCSVSASVPNPSSSTWRSELVLIAGSTAHEKR